MSSRNIEFYFIFTLTIKTWICTVNKINKTEKNVSLFICVLQCKDIIVRVHIARPACFVLVE